MRTDDERAELVAARDAAERQFMEADRMYQEAAWARRLAQRKNNNAALAVYNYDAAQVVD